MLTFTNHAPPAYTPVHGTFTLKLARDLVTVAEWNAYCNDVGIDGTRQGNEQLPVTGVSWHDCQAYIKWYNKKNCENARLPYEWELCLAEQLEGIKDRDWASWPHSHLEASTWNGDHYNDLVGVVNQWCAGEADYTLVTRGGSWLNTASSLRASNRSRRGPSDRFSNLGFRLAFH